SPPERPLVVRMSESGHSRRFHNVRGSSAMPPISTVTADIPDQQPWSRGTFRAYVERQALSHCRGIRWACARRQPDASRRAGEPQLRRAHATAATNAGVDEDTVGKLLNHGGRSVTSRYIKTS